MTEKPVWLITGAASGFGQEIAAEALRRGARVVATARDPGRIALVGEDVLVLPLDVTDRTAIASTVREAEARFGRIDVLVNNAGYGLIAAIEEATQDEIDALIGTHFTGTLDLIRAVLPGMRARRRGHIVNFSSIAGFTGGAGTALYAAAKFAVEGLSEGLAKEVAPLGIKVTIVEPGPFQTSFFTSSRKMGERRLADYDATAGAYRDRASKPDPWLPGDPARGAAAVVDAVAMADPPLRLLLGKFAYDMALAAYAARVAEAEGFRELTLSADKPEATGREWP